jgi:hypothetical protein
MWFTQYQAGIIIDALELWLKEDGEGELPKAQNSARRLIAKFKQFRNDAVEEVKESA